jgi:hypothetical protein
MAKIVVKGRYTGGALRYPKVSEEGKAPQYNCVILLDEADVAKVDAAVAEVVKDKWAGKMPPGTINYANRKGDDPDMATYEKRYLNAKSGSTGKGGVPKKRPGMFIKKGGEFVELDQDDETIYPGCYIAAEIDIYGYDGDKAKSIKPGITVGLNKVMFLRDGDRLTSQTTAAQAFQGFDSEFDSELLENPFG